MAMATAARPGLWRIVFLLLAASGQAFLVQAPASAQEASPFVKLAGRWLGEGRFGTKDGKTEAVKCRVTYVVSDQGQAVLAAAGFSAP